MEENIKKVKVTIDGKEILVNEGSTILEAAQQNDIYIPTLCHHAALSSWGGCRICVVEVDGSPKLVASCVTPVREGMEVVTSNARVIESRRTILEFLFAERNHNCMFCPQSGDCELQKLAYELQMDHLTVSFSFKEFPADITNEYMAIDHNRCILCGRCIRACREIAGAYVLNYHNRGPHSLIGFDLNEAREQSSCNKSGVCMQVCPTGAIYNRYRTHYAVKGHSKDWQTIESHCSQCGLLCPTISFVQDNHLLKIEGVLANDNGRPDRGQLCYKGRFETFKSMGERLFYPMVQKEDGRWTKETWESAIDIVVTRLEAVRKTYGGQAIFGLTSSSCSNEELYTFKYIMSKGFGVDSLDTFDGPHLKAISRMWETMKKPFKEASWRLIPESDLIMVIGGNPYASQPVISSLIHRSIIENGIRVGVVGSVDPFHPWTSHYLPANKENIALVLKAFLTRTILSFPEKTSELKTLSMISRETSDDDIPALLKEACFDEEDQKAFYEVIKLFVESKNPLFIVGEVLTGLEDVSALKSVVDLALLKGVLPGDVLRLIILKAYGNSAGAWRLGVHSLTDTNGKKKYKGGVIVLNGEDITDSAILEKLKGLEFLAVVSPYFPKALENKAGVLIPKPLPLEEEGSYTSLDGFEVGYKKKVLVSPKGVKDLWKILCALGEKTKTPFDFTNWDDLCKKAQQAVRNKPHQL